MEPEQVAGEGGPMEINIPLIALNNAMLRIDTHASGERMLVIGPIALAINLNNDLEKWLVEQLKGTSIVIATPAQMPRDFSL